MSALSPISPIVLLADSAPPAEVHSPQLIDLDGTAFVQFGLFLLLVAILSKLLWKPYLRVKGERVSRVDGYRKAAQAMDTDAAARLAKAEAAMAEARRVGSTERTKARVEAQATEQALVASAQADAQKDLAAARGRLDGIVTRERARIATVAAEMGAEAARRILGRDVSRS